MGCNLKQFSQYLESLLEVARFQDVAFNGIQVEGTEELRKIATSVSASLYAINEAARLGAGLLLVHHGLFLKGKDVQLVGVLKKKVEILFENQISLAAYHLPLDAHRLFGNNWKAAFDLGFTECAPFGFYQSEAIGVKGKFPEMARSAFIEKLQRYYGQKGHAALGGKERVSSCAIVSGGAYKLIDEAILSQVDCFVTGNFDEPVWHKAHEEGINFLAFGHAPTEKIGPKALGEHLAEQFQLEHVFIDENNPF